MSVARHAINALNRFKLFVRTTGDAGQEESDEDFDARLAKIRKNETAPGGQRKAKTPYEQLQENKKAAGQKKQQDWGAESVYFESAPHRGDLAINVLLVRPAAFASKFCHHEHQKQLQSTHAQVVAAGCLDVLAGFSQGATLLWLPLTIAAIGRGAFVKYRFSDKRISVITSAPWKSAPAEPLLHPSLFESAGKCMLQPCCISLACRRGRLLPCMSAASPGGNGRNGSWPHIDTCLIFSLQMSNWMRRTRRSSL